MTSPQAEPVLQCPKCLEPMRKLTADDIIVDRCERCFGVWLDAGERVKFKGHKKLADVVDIGPVDKARDEITEVDCPRCGVPMEHRHHPDQRHIGFEECPQCRGSFFDAGELRDLARFSLSDLVSIFVRRK